MSYDFETLPHRRGTNSSKWMAMLKENPDLPENIVPFTTADMEFKNAPEITDGLREYLNEAVLGYGGTGREYLQVVCDFIKRHHQWDIQPEWIQTATGVVNAICDSVRAFTEPGDGIILFTPVYFPFYSSVTMNHRVEVKCPLTDREGHYEIDWGDLEEKAGQKNTKALLLCNPHNPIGRVWTREELRRIADICLKHDLLIFSDEIHFDLIMPGHEHTMIASLFPEIAQRCITYTSPGKSFNLTGMCTSHVIVANPELKKKLSDQMMCGGAGWNLPLLGYKATELAYTRCDKWLKQLIEVIDKNRLLVETYMETYLPEIKVYPMEGTYLQWWDCRKLGLDAKQLQQFMREKAFLYLDEGYLFGDEGKGFERMNLACPPKVLQEALERLKKAVKG